MDEAADGRDVDMFSEQDPEALPSLGHGQRLVAQLRERPIGERGEERAGVLRAGRMAAAGRGGEHGDTE